VSLVSLTPNDADGCPLVVQKLALANPAGKPASPLPPLSSPSRHNLDGAARNPSECARVASRFCCSPSLRFPPSPPARGGLAFFFFGLTQSVLLLLPANATSVRIGVVYCNGGDRLPPPLFGRDSLPFFPPLVVCFYVFVDLLLIERRVARKGRHRRHFQHLDGQEPGRICQPYAKPAAQRKAQRKASSREAKKEACCGPSTFCSGYEQRHHKLCSETGDSNAQSERRFPGQDCPEASFGRTAQHRRVANGTAPRRPNTKAPYREDAPAARIPAWWDPSISSPRALS